MLLIDWINVKVSMQQKHGFTLIELSIVLVIIGLLIGGILVGQALIKSAELNRVVSEFQQYKIAIHNFENKLKCLPGDCAKATDYFNTTSGNGDGEVDYAGEHIRVWQHLNLAGEIQKSYTGVWTGNGSEAGVNMPQSILGENIGWNLMFQDTIYQNGSPKGNPKNRLRLARERSTSGNYLADESSVFALDAAAIDEKIDDGLPMEGSIHGQRGYGASYCFHPTDASARYVVSYTIAPSCFLTFDLN